VSPDAAYGNAEEDKVTDAVNRLGGGRGYRAPRETAPATRWGQRAQSREIRTGGQVADPVFIYPPVATPAMAHALRRALALV
jgi:hypothetical protein